MKFVEGRCLCLLVLVIQRQVPGCERSSEAKLGGVGHGVMGEL